jgi:small-conductance mechanosensitive channel
LGYYISYHTTAGNLLNINFVSNKATVVAFTVILGIFMAATLLYLCVQLFKSLKRCSEQPWRNKVFLGLSLVYIPLLTAGVCGLALSFYRFGKYSIVLLLNVNIYCWAQMFLYTPVKSDELRAAEPIQGIESNSNFNTEYANNPENEIVYKEDDPNKEGEDKDYNNLG